jgi:hydroxymethylpyrimidine pyrophosphatase-like HAD family hydrolase
MQYKAIVFDVDGTAVPLASHLPSKRLQDAISLAQKQFNVSAATGRSYEFAKPVFTNLGLKAPSILLGGTAIIDPKNYKILWHKSMTEIQAKLVLKSLGKYRCTIYVGDSPIVGAVPLKDYKYGKQPASVIYALGILPADVAGLVDDVSQITDIAVHTTPSWSAKKVDAHITHRAATKQHSVEELIKILGLKKEEVIGVGDSGNDIPIFKAVGHKIAMGNAEDSLKEKADEIAPTVDEDGLAKVIEKYFL